ncbi:MAG: DUF116 domain-containing protein [Candidatus Bathyarchaeota archaeon]|nr:MAG: DUF116 domain-containing protein [Candidatus Bathyarchaeota archaeon]
MPYSFIYDLTRIPQGVIKQLFTLAYGARLHKLLGGQAKRFVKAFKIDEATGLNLVDAIALVEDLIEVQVANSIQRDKFERAERKALLLPHCARSCMDKQCMADFKADVPNYECKGCRGSCLINKATALGKAKGYDVYVIPGGACAERILKDKEYDGVVGVACGMELKMGLGLLKKLGIPGQGIFLTKNGCSNTSLNLQNLARTL